MPKSDQNLLTQAEYARSRKARGLSGGSREAVRKAVDAGRIKCFGPNKLVDLEMADRDWARNTQARASTVAAPPGATPNVSEPAAAGDLVDRAGADPGLTEPPADATVASSNDGQQPQLHADPGYQLSRSRQAAADAKTAEIKLAELEGSLIRLDQVRAVYAARLAPVREALLQIPARLAPLLAPQSDPGRIQTLLEVEIHQVLAPLADKSELRATEGIGAA